MSLYLDSRVSSREPGASSSLALWHPNLPFLAVASYSPEKGGVVRIYDEQGELVPEIESAGHSVARVTAIAWHPERRKLIAAWESGELRNWPGDEGSTEFHVLVTPHRDPVTILRWSQHGTRLISADTAGSLIGWKIDSRGQLLIMFHHELQDSLVDMAFKLTLPKPPSFDMSLAKAAVAGDERALDLFSSWRPKTATRTVAPVQRDNYAFYAALSRGRVFFVDVEGQCVEVLDTNGANIVSLLHHQTRDSLVVMSSGYNIGYYQADPNNGKLVEITRVKLSGKSSDLYSGGYGVPIMSWIDANTLAILTLDAIRCWDLHSGDTWTLAPPELDTPINQASAQQLLTSLSFCKINETLAVGTNVGTVYFWKRKLHSEVAEDDSWPKYPDSCTVLGAVRQLSWGAAFLRNPILAVNCTSEIFILHQQPTCSASNDGTVAYQMGPTKIALERLNGTWSYILHTDIQIRLIAVDKDHVAVSSGRALAIYAMQTIKNSNDTSCTVVSSFTCDSEKLAIYEGILIVLTTVAVELRSIQDNGVILQTLSALPEEGEPITLELSQRYLTVGSLNGFLRVWEMSSDCDETTAKPCARVAALPDLLDDFAEIIEARCNSDCRFVSITIATSNLMPSSILYVWQVDNDRLDSLDFAALHFEASSYQGNRLVTSHCWDNDDPRLLVCQSENIGGPRDSAVALVTVFVSAEHGIVVQDIREMSDPDCRLLSAESPCVTVLNGKTWSTGTDRVNRLPMRDFEELVNCDGPTKAAILDFSYHLSVANMDEAFRAIKSIKNEAVWKSLARMCVKTKQLDMAMLCLGHMKQAKSARALREAMQDPSFSLEARVGVLAVELQLYDDAERLFREAQKWDLVSSLLEARNKFREAIDFTRNEYKIGEKTTLYNYAKALESEGNIQEAIEMYTKAECHRFEVPRMLLGVAAATPMTTTKQLETYLSSQDVSSDPELLKWHAQYVESRGDLKGALELYKKAEDWLSITRLLCFLGREDEACDVANKSQDAASAYHLAAHYDAKNNVSKAVHFYVTAKAYTNAIRLCKENDMAEELWPLATLAPRALQIDIGKYYEANDRPDRAILLYHKAGMLRKALDLAFKTRQFNALQLMAMDVNADSDPALVDKCATYFVRNEQVDKAVDLLLLGNKHVEALQLMRQRDVPLTEELAEKMAGSRPEKDPERERARLATLETIGEIALQQGNYHLATKKFTQAGDKARAMKALLKSGDTEKICFFAQVSRQPEIYVMAGNYLQTLDWQNQPGVVEHITAFYSKAKAMDLLANFYVNCAEVEVDEYRNYEKALEALNQASKCLSKVIEPRDAELHRKVLNVVNERMSIVRRYLEMKRLLDRGETELGLSHARHLLEVEPAQLEKAVRVGDFFATMSQHYVDIGQLDKARKSVEELERFMPGVQLARHYSPQLLETLGYKRANNDSSANSGDHDEREEDDIQEFLGE